MYLLYFFARTFPWWGIPFAILLAEQGWRVRVKSKDLQMFLWALALIVLGLVGAWIFFRGDLHANRWMDNIVRNLTPVGLSDPQK